MKLNNVTRSPHDWFSPLHDINNHVTSWSHDLLTDSLLCMTSIIMWPHNLIIESLLFMASIIMWSNDLVTQWPILTSSQHLIIMWPHDSMTYTLSISSAFSSSLSACCVRSSIRLRFCRLSLSSLSCCLSRSFSAWLSRTFMEWRIARDSWEHQADSIKYVRSQLYSE